MYFYSFSNNTGFIPQCFTSYNRSEHIQFIIMDICFQTNIYSENIVWHTHTDTHTNMHENEKYTKQF